MMNEVVVIGGGMAGLSCAAILTQAGKKVVVLEQSHLPGGCSSSYWRKGAVFESGATTLVGLGEGYPLQYVLDVCQIKLKEAWPLALPMKIHLKDGRSIHKYSDREAWIQEAERVFGPENQRVFWQECYRIQELVWQQSLKHLQFHWRNGRDVWSSLKNMDLKVLSLAPYIWMSVEDLLRKHHLHKHPAFTAYIHEQLMITAQNSASEVNALFGAAALCYTQLPNYYLKGGLIQLVQPFVDYIQARGNAVHLKQEVVKVEKRGSYYEVITLKESFLSQKVVFAVSLNQAARMTNLPEIERSFRKSILGPKLLNSAFQMGIIFKPHQDWDCIHHQIHHEGLAGLEAKSIFLSLQHPDDDSRCDDTSLRVASVSTHVSHPDVFDNSLKQSLAEAILDILDKKGFVRRENVVYFHASGPKEWERWTKRPWGFVGGYPQMMRVKPWQMVEHRLYKQELYICGDSTYPGQGIPGVALSGLIAAKKVLSDG